ncbi:MAG: hypothetical protein GXO90_02695 [FCB group bacterium]|nr:hypothetical protein [FCB group bacterium]
MNSIRRFIILTLVWGSGVLPAQSLLDSLNTFLHPPGGLVLSGAITQKQYDREWEGRADVILSQYRDIGLLTDQEFVRVDQDTIWTYNLASHQVLIDSYSWDQFNLFELLSGDFAQVGLERIDRSQTGIIQYYSIPEMGITGYLKLKKSNYEPEFLHLSYDANNRVEIQVKSVSTPAILPDFINDKTWEVIDLRE